MIIIIIISLNKCKKINNERSRKTGYDQEWNDLYSEKKSNIS